MAQSWEQYMRDQEAAAEPSDADFLENCGLDAYGHLNWTVGNEDWIACFDAILSPDGTRIAYHVVVDCESGGFLDVPDKGVVRIDDDNALLNLAALPGYWADICCEYYVGDNDYPTPDPEETADCAKRWEVHLACLVKQATESA